MDLVHVVAVGQSLNGGLTNVLILHPTQEIVDQAFPQCPACGLHAVDFERFEDPDQHRQAASENRRPVAREPRQTDPVDLPRFDEELADLLQSRQGDGGLARRQLTENFLDREDGAGGADGDVPTCIPVDFLDGFELLSGEIHRVPELSGFQPAVAKAAIGHLHATHVQALEYFRPELPAQDRDQDFYLVEREEPGRIADTLVDSFCKRAREIYGARG